MTAITNKVFEEGESWLTKERQKFESFAEENFQKFSTECQQEIDWLRNYLQDIIFQTTKVEILKKNEFLEISNKVTDNSVTRQTRGLAAKHTPKSKHERPEIKSLVLAAAAAKRVNSNWFILYN